MTSLAAFLIDDDPFVRLNWQTQGRRKGRSIEAIASPLGFEKYCSLLDKEETPIFIDQDLGAAVSGLAFAKGLHEKGFQRLYLATSYESDDFLGHAFLKGVVGKEPPEWLFEPSDLWRQALTKSERDQLVRSLDPAGRAAFSKRMGQLYEARFGGFSPAFPFADASGAYWPEPVLAAWERAIYENVSDLELARRLDETWRCSR